MIRLSDAIILALTKLRTRKIRTIVTVFTASLLFSGLTIAAFTAGGVLDSARRFTSGSLSERYIANVFFSPRDDAYNNPEVQARATELYPQIIAEKKAAAKQLGIEYNPATEPKPVEENDYNKYLNVESLASRRALEEYYAKQPTPQDKTKAVANAYHPKEYFNFGHSTIDGRLKLLKEGKEDFAEKVNTGYSSTQDITGGWSYLSLSVLKPFLVEQKYLDAQQNKNDLPVIAPYSKVEAALKLAPLAKNASPQERFDRIKEVRARAASVTFTTCYRNGASQSQIDQAQQVARQIEQNKNNKDYQKPSLIYGLPQPESCEPATILSDTRTTDEKKLSKKQEEFDKKFGAFVDPVQQKISARVVGISPDGFDMGNFSSVDVLISMIAGSSLQGAWAVPQELYDQLPNKTDYDKFHAASGKALEVSSTIFMPQTGQLVEFSNAEDAKAFMTKEGCSGPDCSETKPLITYFGSNSVLVQDLTDGVGATIGYIGIGIAVIAALILMGMVGRVIGDSRRETAVFRAIGAKRNDIRAIYVLYTLFLSLLIAIITVSIGLGVALWFDGQFSGEATVRAQLTFVGADEDTQFHLFGIWWQALVAIVGLIILSGFVSMLLPISRNLARSPIKDMRDDT